MLSWVKARCGSMNGKSIPSKLITCASLPQASRVCYLNIQEKWWYSQPSSTIPSHHGKTSEDLAPSHTRSHMAMEKRWETHCSCTERSAPETLPPSRTPLPLGAHGTKHSWCNSQWDQNPKREAIHKKKKNKQLCFVGKKKQLRKAKALAPLRKPSSNPSGWLSFCA